MSEADPFAPPELETPAEPKTPRPETAPRSPAPPLPTTWGAPTSRAVVPPEITPIEIKCRCSSTAGYLDTRNGSRFCAKCGRSIR